MDRNKIRIIALICFITLAALTGCGKSEAPAPAGEQPSAPPAAPLAQVPQAAADATQQAGPAGTVAEVDGLKLTEDQLEQEYKRTYSFLKQNLTEEKFKEESPKIKVRLVNDFIAKALLQNEMKRRNIKAADKEIDATIENMRKSMPPGTTLEDQLKKSQMTMERLRQETAMGIGVSKLVKQYGGDKLKPKDKDIREFYKKNQDKFKVPETARARHILIAKAKTDDDKTKAEKKAKAEEVRKELLAGADFAQLAAKYSDCPSKANGGDLGTFPRGQMVKPFEDAVYSQKLKETGPVVETDFGYHIIQVTERNPAGVQPLNSESKKMIADYLERENQINAYRKLMDELKGKASISVYKKY